MRKAAYGLAAAAVQAAWMTGGAIAKDIPEPGTPTHLSCSGAPQEIRVFIRNVRKSVGLITVELYRNDEARFLSNEGREQRFRFAAVAPVTQFCIHSARADSYALGVYHDKNANLQMDKGAFGIPVEPYGMSNNPPMRMAAPTLAESLFQVAADGATVDIKLRN